MGKSPNKKKVEKDEVMNLGPRNWQASGNGGHTLLYAESLEEATVLGKAILGIKINEPITVNPYPSKALK